MANYFDQFDTPKASGGNYFDQFDPAKPAPERTWGEAASDTALGLAKGAVGVAKLLPMAVGAADTVISRAFGLESPASGGALANAPVKALGRVEEYLQSQKSEAIKAKEAESQLQAEETGQKYADDFVVGDVPIGRIAAEFASKFGSALTDPALLAQGVSENIASVIPAGAGARATQVAAENVIPRVAKSLTVEAVETTARRLGTAGGIATGAVQQGTDVASETYDKVLALPDTAWEKNSRFIELSTDLGADKAKAQIAGELATDAGIKAGLESLVVNAAGAKFGGATLESAFLKKPTGAVPSTTGGLIKGALRGGFGEAATEAPEEGYGAYVTNLAQAEIAPETDLFKGVGAAAGQGAVTAFGMGGVAGGVEGRQGALISRARQAQAEDAMRTAQTADDAIAAASDLANATTDLTPAVTDYLRRTGAPVLSTEQEAGVAAEIPTLAERQALLDRNAQLMQQANAAGFEADRQNALAQAQTALPAPSGRVAEGFVDLTPMDERQAQTRLSILRDQTANAGGNALALAVVPHPSLAGKYAIGSQTLPSLELGGAAPTVSPAEAQQRLETAALTGSVAQRKAEDQPRQAVIDQALRRVEARNGVASPAEAQIFQEAGLGKPYDRIDTNLTPALSTDERLTQATGIALERTPRETGTESQRLAAVEAANAESMAEQTRRREMERAQAERQTQQQIEAVSKPAALPDANAVIAALQTAPAMRTPEQKTAIDQANSRMESSDVGILQKAAQAPMLLSATDKLRLTKLRAGEVQAGVPAEEIVPSIKPSTAREGEAPRPNKIQGQAVANYTDDQLQALVKDTNVPAVTRRNASVELAARLAQGAPAAPVAAAPAAVTNERITQPTEGKIINTTVKLPETRSFVPGAKITVNQDGTPHTFTVADTSTLGDQGKLLTQVGRIFGKRLVVFESDTMNADGFVTDDDNGSVYVNAKSTISPLAVFGHELTHLFKRDNSEAYAALESVVQRTLAPEGMEKFTAEYGAGANIEELTSDLVGNRFQEAEFWGQVFDEIAAQDPENARGIVTRLAAAVQKAINAFMRVVRQPGFQADQYVSDLQGVKAAVRQAVTTYAKQQREPAGRMEAELAKAEAKIDLAAGSRESVTITPTGEPNARLTQPRRGAGVSEPSAQDGRIAGEAGRGEIPSYGTAREGAISVAARHYSTTPREFLNGAYYGKGLKGAERDRLDSSTDPRLKNRIYFYVDEGSGIRPESGVGGYAHEVQLQNIYDPKTRLVKTQGDFNAFESAVINAGFDGYIAPFGNNQSAVVLLGLKHKAVPVKGIGQPAAAAPVEKAAPAVLKKGLMSKELEQIDTSNIPGAQVRMGNLEVPADQIEAANTELERIGSSVKFSTRRKAKEVPTTLDDFAKLESIIPRAREGSFNTNRELKVYLQDAITAEAKAAKVDLSSRDEQTSAYLTRVGVDDALYAIKSNANAVGWYDKTVTKALKVLGTIHPEINTDPDAKFAFTWALAVTSNGLKVDKNFELAERVYNDYKRTGKMSTDIKAGQAQKAINDSLDLFNQMTARYGVENVRKFMDSKFAVAQIERATGEKVGGEFADTEVRGAAVLGPKIGNGFYSNLNGFFDQLTMDRWLMRTWGRWTGSLIETRPDMVRTKRAELKDLVAQMKQNAPAAAEFQRVIGQRLNAADLDGLAKAIAKASMLPANRDVMNKTSAGEGLRKTGNSLVKYLDGQKEAPAGPEERDFIRKIFGRILQEVRTQGYEALTMSDLQALLWYPERRLYDIAKSDENTQEGYADDEAPDYANAAIKLARSLGVSNDSIENATREAEIDYENRISTRPAERAAGKLEAEAGVTPGVRGFTQREKREFLTTGIISSIRSNRERDGAVPDTYTRKSGGDGRGVRVLDVPSVAVFAPDRKFSNALAAIPSAAPKLFELDERGAETFQNAIQASKDASPFGAAVYVYDLSDYKGMRLFMTEDAKAGFALKGNDIVSVFSGPEHKGSVNAMMQLAIQEGGQRLDAFHTVLPNLYATHGFKIVARTPWNEDYKPEGWDKATFKEFNNGEPDVVFMVYDPTYFGKPTIKDGKVLDNYEDGAQAQAEALTKPEQKAGAGLGESLKSIFEGLDKRGLAKTRAEAALKAHPDAAQLQYVQDNFLDILDQLDESGLVEINCD